VSLITLEHPVVAFDGLGVVLLQVMDQNTNLYVIGALALSEEDLDALLLLALTQNVLLHLSIKQPIRSTVTLASGTTGTHQLEIKTETPHLEYNGTVVTSMLPFCPKLPT